jgi:hypothetical protein
MDADKDMPRLLFDFDSVEKASKYPRHGWARNSQGVKLLWFPVLSLVRSTNTVRQGKGDLALPPDKARAWLPFYDGIRNLMIVLREISLLVRVPVSFRPDDPEGRERAWRAAELVPVHVDSAYLQLRRLADRLVVAVRPVLFAKSGEVSPEFRKLRNVIQDDCSMDRLKPICDTKLLRDAFDKHSSWFDILSHEEGGHKGIRDALEHTGVRMSSHLQQVGDEPTKFLLSLGPSPDVDNRWRDNLLSTLSHVIDGLCNLCSDIHSSVGVGTAYDQGDYVFLPGEDGDITKFWPEI